MSHECVKIAVTVSEAPAGFHYLRGAYTAGKTRGCVSEAAAPKRRWEAVRAGSSRTGPTIHGPKWTIYARTMPLSAT